MPQEIERKFLVRDDSYKAMAIKRSVSGKGISVVKEGAPCGYVSRMRKVI